MKIEKQKKEPFQIPFLNCIVKNYLAFQVPPANSHVVFNASICALV